MLARKARNFIRRQRRTKPFFLLLAPKAPHTSRKRGPAEPAGRHKGNFADLTLPIYKEAFNEVDVVDKPGFVQAVPPMDEEAIADATTRFRAARESLLAVDDMVETVARALGEKKLLRRTVIIFTSDNGYLFGAHRLIGKGVGYEESIRVPLLMRGPGIPKGELRAQMVSNLDVVATIVALSGAVPGYALDGKSLLPVISNPDAIWRTAMLVQGITPKRGRYVAARAQTSVYVEHESMTFGLEQEYYDLLSDPQQLMNRAGDAAYQAKVAALRALLERLKICGGESCWATDDVEGPASAPRGIGRTTVYRGSLPKIYRLRREYDVQQSLDE
jgi:arylsulfatase A-like enzyme